MYLSIEVFLGNCVLCFMKFKIFFPCKELLWVWLFWPVLFACNGYMQVFETSSLDVSKQKGGFVFENDTVKVTYDFWAERGVLSFSVFNKSDAPIYIDWSKSAFIVNSKKLNYWIDREVSHSMGFYTGYLYRSSRSSARNAQYGINASKKVVDKEEKITFLPPRSSYSRTQFILLNLEYYEMGDNASLIRTLSNYSPKDSVQVYFESFTEDSTILTFRNFLSLSFSNGFDSIFYIDNGFYVSQVLEMKYSNFLGTPKQTEEGDYYYLNNYKSPDKFFMDVPFGYHLKRKKK